MRIGTIIVLHNNAKHIDKNFLSKELPVQIELCLVNNGSSDNTLDLLKIIKEESNAAISVVDIKKNTTQLSAIRAGARFLFNSQNFRYIGYIDATFIKNKEELNFVLETFYDHKDPILEYNKVKKENQKRKKTLFQNVFSILEVLKRLNVTCCISQ